MKNLKMNKIINTNTHDCFFHADAQGRVYIGKGEKGGITLSIYDVTGDIRDFTVKDQIVCSDILLFQQCANGYVFVYYDSHEPKVKVFSEEGRVRSAFCLPSGVSCCLLDEKQHLWVGLCDEGIYHDENPKGDSVWCFTLDGKQKEMYIDRKLEEMDAPVVDDCYGLAEKNGLIYMLYYGDAVAAFDENVVRRVWILSDEAPKSEAFDQLTVSKEGFWVGTVNCYRADLKPSLYLISADVSLPMQEVKCCDSNGVALDVQQLKLTSNAVYAVTSSGVYKQDIQ
ncbi:DNA-binding protein [Alkalihalobacillus halodurans]|nr:DNA-binding protein [Halalkalibacterium halodurans]